MNLLLDVGNTAVKWACFTNGRPGTSGRFVHRAGDVGALADAAWSGLQPADKVLIANVAGREMQTALAAWFLDNWQVPPVFLRATARACGVSNAYSDPATLGIDRWAAVVAAHHGYPGAVCVVDCGTAVTLDLVTAGGEHRGGLILPGIEMLHQLLLHLGAAQVDVAIAQAQVLADVVLVHLDRRSVGTVQDLELLSENLDLAAPDLKIREFEHAALVVDVL